MTREEAKIFLCSIADDLGFTDIENYTCKDGEKMREAIKTLSHESCDDAISREAALICLTGKFEPDKEYKPEELIALFSKRIKALPSVTQKSGHWIRIEEKYGYHYKCSKCGYESEIPTVMGKLVWKGCPYCLAEMVESQESEIKNEKAN